MRPVPCGRLGCEACTPYLAWRRGQAIRWARPERRFDLTKVGPDIATARARVKRLRYRLVQEEGIDVEWAYSLEPNPKGTGNHLHGYQRGDFVPQDVLSRVARRCGMGEVVWIERLREDAGGYALKGLGYGLKGYSRAESVDRFLSLNGGRLTHQSRGFFRGPVREAERAALDERRDGESPWMVASVSELDRAMPRPR